MSTPLSPDNTLHGALLYAPRRVRERLSQDEAAVAPTPMQPDTRQAEHDQTRANENANCPNEADEADGLDWVEQAIRTLIELEHGTGVLAASDPQVAGQQSPPVAPAQGESDDWLPPISPAQRQEHRDGQNSRRRRRSLEPEIVPYPPAAMQDRGLSHFFMRFSLVIVFAGIVAYGLTMISTAQPVALWLKGATDHVAGIALSAKRMQGESHSPSRLVVEDQQAFANEPVSLAVNIEHAMDSESLLLDGLTQGTTLSAGTSLSPFSWRLLSDQLPGLYLYAPKDFVGVMNTTVNLLGSDKRLLDSRAMQLKWITPAPKPAVAAVNYEAPGGDPINAGTSGVATIKPIDPGQAEMLTQRARDFLSAGDISAARVAFRRLADAGMPDAALALANTYDPEYLAAHHFVGVTGDRTMARALYQRAKELGSAEAGRILAHLVAN